MAIFCCGIIIFVSVCKLDFQTFSYSISCKTAVWRLPRDWIVCVKNGCQYQCNRLPGKALQNTSQTFKYLLYPTNNAAFQLLSSDNCLKDKREDYQNCSVYYVPQLYSDRHMSSSYRWTWTCWFRSRFHVCVFLCIFSLLGSVCLPWMLVILCFACIIWSLFGCQSAPVQLIAWKDSVMTCVELDVKLPVAEW